MINMIALYSKIQIWKIAIKDIVNLLPNGSNITVTNVNKEHYLNLLANYRLIHTVEQEITEFRNGLYDVIEMDTLSDFLEHDLQVRFFC